MDRLVSLRLPFRGKFESRPCCEYGRNSPPTPPVTVALLHTPPSQTPRAIPFVTRPALPFDQSRLRWGRRLLQTHSLLLLLRQDMPTQSLPRISRIRRVPHHRRRCYCLLHKLARVLCGPKRTSMCWGRIAGLSRIGLCMVAADCRIEPYSRFSFDCFGCVTAPLLSGE